jgi:UDP-N-acetylglucosamine--N-acetylmuramyl-(pentapeptide) pyrophosphoryl-undecaprenol N-acetylglucosamine transferase
MSQSLVVAMAGGGTGGHVIPALAVARELAGRGHRPFFIGTRRGMEARLVPEAGFDIEWIEIGGLNRVGLARMLKSACELPASIWRAAGLLERRGAQAVFSMGGYAAGPVMLAAIWKGVPMAVMEPNAMPGLTSRKLRRWVRRAMLSFPEAARHFRPGRTEITGLPVRREFFALEPKPRGETFTILITGGSQGSRTLNEAARASWPLINQSGLRVRFLHQAGTAAAAEIARDFEAAGMDGHVTAFIGNMPGAFAEADLVVCRSGAGAVAELAAAGKPSLLVPFPFAADQHQLRNAEAFARAGAARLVPDGEMNGERLCREVAALASDPDLLKRMGGAARSMAHPDAARRAAEIIEEMSPVCG